MVEKKLDNKKEYKICQKWNVSRVLISKEKEKAYLSTKDAAELLLNATIPMETSQPTFHVFSNNAPQIVLVFNGNCIILHDWIHIQ